MVKHRTNCSISCICALIKHYQDVSHGFVCKNATVPIVSLFVFLLTRQHGTLGASVILQLRVWALV